MDRTRLTDPLVLYTNAARLVTEVKGIAVMKSTMLLVSVIIASTAAAQQPQRSVQQDFEAAAALDAGTDHAAAARAWQALEQRTRGNRRNHAIVLVREGDALSRVGMLDEAVAALRAGLADLPESDATLRDDRIKAYFNLAAIDELALDYAGAADAYTKAEGMATAPAEQLAAQIGLLRTQTFVDPAAASAAARRADTLLDSTKAEKALRGEVEMREAVLALNRNDIEAAQNLSRASISDLGGMTTRVDLRDVSARSTAAIASLLAGNKEEARRYMAMTGAGRMDSVAVANGADMPLPDCGGEAGLKPADFAVVEFSIADDGSVVGVSPVYAQGGGSVALEFARAVANWSWEPTVVKKLPGFFRNHVRMEMRCSTGFEHPSLIDFLQTRTRGWLKDQGAQLPDAGDRSDALAVVAQRSALASEEARGPDSVATLAALVTLLGNKTVGREEKGQLASRALAIAQRLKAPAVTLADLELAKVANSSADAMKRTTRMEAITTLIARPDYVNDHDAQAVLRLALADIDRNDKRRIATLRTVADDPALAATNPLKVGALIRIASIERQNGSTDAARAAFKQSGLSADQCALVDAKPKMLHAGGSFPQEALAWGFEGYTKTQFDIDADGNVVNERVILAYPPFVFTDASRKTIAGARFAKSYRPDGGLACGSETVRVSFARP
jgi:hypothetical protein